MLALYQVEVCGGIKVSAGMNARPKVFYLAKWREAS
jgi:hypothetical protein